VARRARRHGRASVSGPYPQVAFPGQGRGASTCCQSSCEMIAEFGTILDPHCERGRGRATCCRVPGRRSNVFSAPDQLTGVLLIRETRLTAPSFHRAPRRPRNPSRLRRSTIRPAPSPLAYHSNICTTTRASSGKNPPRASPSSSGYPFASVLPLDPAPATVRYPNVTSRLQNPRPAGRRVPLDFWLPSPAGTARRHACTATSVSACSFALSIPWLKNGKFLNANAEEPELLHHAQRVGQIPRDARRIVHEEHVEGSVGVPRPVSSRLNPWPFETSYPDRGIRIDVWPRGIAILGHPRTVARWRSDR